jgi:CDP-diacylglycerol---glycerol-3-phosphate 3-phosphatidyltransferase
MLTNLARAWGAKIVQPVARFLSRLGLTPNGATLLGFAMTLGVAVLLALGHLRLGGILLIPTLAFDAVDGTLARLTGAVTRFGAVLDSTLDRWAEIAIYAALVWYYTQTEFDLGIWLATAAMATSLMVSYTRARAEGAGFTLREGLFTRLERLIVLIAGLIFNLTIWSLLVISILAGFTALQRLWVVRKMDRATK